MEKEKKQSHSSVYSRLKGERTTNPLSSFMVSPAVKFETQTEGEKVLLLLRQHPVTNLGWGLVSLVMLFVPAFWELLPSGLLPTKFWWVGVALWYIMVALFMVEKFLDWYFNVYIVTDERVVDIDFYGLVYRDMSVAQLSKLEDVNFKQTGGVAAMFDYGNVFLQTAGEQREFDFAKVPHPSRVVEIIYELIQEEEQEGHEGRVA